jgi:hypothetical protein
MEEGDFSKSIRNIKNNFNGPLFQQGRVFLDSDFNDLTKTAINWQDISALDIMGPDVVAVSASDPDAFNVVSATQDQNGIKVKIQNGKAWVDGLLVYGLADSPSSEISEHDPSSLQSIDRTASYLQLNPQKPIDTKINSDTKDAVVLEVWRESVSAFQEIEQLYEPALGGPDTTERVHTATSIKLLRLGRDDMCSNAVDLLKVDDATKGTLTVQLQSEKITNCNCPQVKAGGYTGFEHSLFRIEVSGFSYDADQMFKWSQFNGGLVGTGELTNKKIVIKHNLQAIKTCGLDEFYLEAIERSDYQEPWKVTFGARVKINRDEDTLEILDTPLGVTQPTNPFFFRLWNGIRKISDFPVSTPPIELIDGIILQFDSPSSKIFLPRDYWTFEVRVGEVISGDIMTSQLPQGIHYHRAPLAIIQWVKNQGGKISDCRKIFEPLGKCCGNCTITAIPGDDLSSLINSLKKDGDREGGGKICLTQGTFLVNEPIQVDGLENITIEGTGPATQIIINNQESAFVFSNCTGITIDRIHVESSYVTDLKDDPHLNGVVTFSDCENIKITNSVFKCSPRYKRAQACLRFIGTDETKPTSKIEVSNCNFLVGSLQIGIMLVNSSDANIIFNNLEVVPYGNQQISITEKDFFRNDSPYRYVLNAFVKRTAENGIRRYRDMLYMARTNMSSEKSQNFIKNILQDLSVGFQGIVCAGSLESNIRIHDNTIRDFIQGIHVGTSVKDPRHVKTKSSSEISICENTIELAAPKWYGHQKNGIYVGNAIALFIKDNVINVKKRQIPVNKIDVNLSFVDSNEGRFAFHSADGENNPEIDANVGDEIIFHIKNASKWPHTFGVTVSTEGAGPIIQGTEVGTANNLLKPGDSGVATLVASKQGEYYYIGTRVRERALGLEGKIVIAPAPDFAETLARTNLAGIERASSILSEGIRVYGLHGTMVLISGNLVSDTDVGIRFRNLGPLTPYNYDQCLWVLRQNVVYNYKIPYFFYDSADISRIRFTNRDNVPEKIRLDQFVKNFNILPINTLKSIQVETINNLPDDVIANLSAKTIEKLPDATLAKFSSVKGKLSQETIRALNPETKKKLGIQ